MSGKTGQLKNCIAISALLVLLTAATSTTARTIYVDDDKPGDFNNIQAAINDANDGDVVIVAAGTYTGDGNCDIDFKGKAIIVRSKDPNDPNIVAKTIIDCNGTLENPHRGFYFHRSENLSSQLNGVTICNGCVTQALGGVGGAIYCEGGSGPKIINCRIIDSFATSWPLIGGGCGGGIAGCNGEIVNCLISGNRAMLGGGLFICDGIIQNNIIQNNIAGNLGGGMVGCDGVIQNNTISNNKADGTGGGGLASCSGIIHNNVISYNSTWGIGGGMYNKYGGNPVVTNCIIWCNLREQLYYVPVVRYSDVEGGWPGEGNINSDPCFADPNNDDYHLKSQAGRYDPNSKNWVKDDVTSPCIDAGDPASPIGLEPFPNGGIINMGAYGGTSEASKSYFGEPVCETIVAGDINGDCIVDFKDFVIMTSHWLEEQ